MCGIIGYIGKSINIKKVVEKLEKLEYRGYDSAGIIGINKKREIAFRTVGNINKLKEILPNKFNVNLSIAHTRWATHGKPTRENCHPHTSKNESWSIVHNGIIENYLELKNNLKNKPSGDSDSAVLCQFMEEECIDDIYSFIESFKKVKGTYAIVAIKKGEDKLFLAKNKNPLYIAYKDNSFVVASDPICFCNISSKYYALQDCEFAEIAKGQIKFYDKDKKIVQKTQIKYGKIYENLKDKKFKHFMLQEIYEQTGAIQRLIERYQNEKILKQFNKKLLKNIKKIKLIGCGTAYHASLIGARYFEEITNIESSAEIASEFIYKRPLFVDKNTLVIAVSQSGETADTLKAVEVAKMSGALTIGLTNVEYSTLTSVVDKILPVCAGPEKAVASTKAYVCQLCVLYILANHFAKLLNNNGEDYYYELSELSKNVLDFDKSEIEKIAELIKDRNDIIFIGKDYDYISAMEASLKLKEVTYINSTSYPSGELKHGYLALVEKGTPIIVFATGGKLNLKTINSANEAESRGAEKVIITNDESLYETNDRIIKLKCKNKFMLPIMLIVPMQYLAYKVSILKNINPDQPKNLAKSVTVE